MATVASDFGAEVFSREESLADDHSGLLEVVQAHIAALDAIDRTEVFACVLPTALLMSSDDLQDATNLVLKGESRFVLAIGRFSYPIQRALRLDNRREVSMVWPENYRMRSQDLEATYHDAGQFYVGDAETWMTRETMFDSPAQGFLIDDWRVQDIDDEEDWLNAELLWRLNESK